MSVIFEQGGAGAPFGTELATLTPQGASDTWHGACGKNRAGVRRLARDLRPKSPRPPRRLLEIKIYLPYIPGGKK